MKDEINEKKNNVTARSIFWGLLLFGIALVLILEGIGVGSVWGVSVPGMALGVLLIAWLVRLIIKKKFYLIFLPVGLFYTFVLDKPLTKALKLTNVKEDGRIIPIWIVITASVLLCIAFRILFAKKNKTETENGGSGGGHLGNNTVYFDAADLSDAVISENVGSTVAYISNKENYKGDGVISIRNNVGSITLHIPANWLVVTNISENLGKVAVPKQTEPTDNTITVVIKENVGRITVEFDG